MDVEKAYEKANPYYRLVKNGMSLKDIPKKYIDDYTVSAAINRDAREIQYANPGYISPAQYYEVGLKQPYYLSYIPSVYVDDEMKRAAAIFWLTYSKKVPDAPTREKIKKLIEYEQGMYRRVHCDNCWGRPKCQNCVDAEKNRQYEAEKIRRELGLPPVHAKIK